MILAGSEQNPVIRKSQSSDSIDNLQGIWLGKKIQLAIPRFHICLEVMNHLLYNINKFFSSQINITIEVYQWLQMKLKFVTCTSRQLLTTIVTIATTATLATSTFQTCLGIS